MCVRGLRDMCLPSVEAYKVFVAREGVLYSAFVSSWCGLPFELDVEVCVNPAANRFHAFKCMLHAWRVEQLGHNQYLLNEGQLVTYKVTLLDVVASGSFRMNMYNHYSPVYLSKGIIVHRDQVNDPLDPE